MKLVKTLGVVISSSLILASAAFAATNSDKASHKGEHPPKTSAALAAANSDKASRKGDHPPKTAPACAAKTAPAVSRHVKPEAPIVMGRSISAHHKTKLHHVKVNPTEADEGHGDGQL
jgi:hypothetical protein